MSLNKTVFGVSASLMSCVLGPSLYINHSLQMELVDNTNTQGGLVNGEDITANLGDHSHLLHNCDTTQVRDSKGGKMYQLRRSVILKRLPSPGRKSAKHELLMHLNG